MSSQAQRPAVLVVGHGSRNPAANAELEQFVAQFAARHPDRAVEHAYVELASPLLEPALDDLAARSGHVVLAPLFLFAAGHVKNDLPIAMERVRSRHPNTRLEAAQALGTHPMMADLARGRLQEALGEEVRRNERTAVILLGRGSSDPDANADFYKLLRLVAEGGHFPSVFPAFIGITGPRLEDALALVARSRPERVVVLPYFLFAGRLLDRVDRTLAEFRRAYPWIPATRTDHLGACVELVEVFTERLREAEEGADPLPCQSCHYRVPIGRVADRVGGLQALLWSVRHMLTHAQVGPHEHAHSALRKHVLVCGNADCADRGSISLVSRLRHLVKDAGRTRDIRITRTSCMGRCGEGPTVAVYPDGVWYRGVREQDAAELVDEHLIGDRLVTRLLDHVMQ